MQPPNADLRFVCNQNSQRMPDTPCPVRVGAPTVSPESTSGTVSPRSRLRHHSPLQPPWCLRRVRRGVTLLLSLDFLRGLSQVAWQNNRRFSGDAREFLFGTRTAIGPPAAPHPRRDPARCLRPAPAAQFRPRTRDKQSIWRTSHCCQEEIIRCVRRAKSALPSG
jgi:hypothetical protein